MRINMKRLGVATAAGAGALAITAAGLAVPASADDTILTSHDETTTATSAMASIEDFRAWVRDTVSLGDTTAGDVGVEGPLVEGPLVSDSLNGDVASGNDAPILSGNDVDAPVLSGNDTDVDAPVGSGNDVGSGNVVGSGNETDVATGDVTAEVGDVVTDVTSEVGDLTSDIGADVDDAVGDISGDITSDLDGTLSGLLD
jgi:hypothetical protein